MKFSDVLRRLLPFTLFLAGGAFAAEKAQSLLPLKRMTVGPYDNFQATVDEGEKFLYYTRSENLSSQIMRLDLATGLTEAITKRDADAKMPALNPEGKILAFNYFKNDAKGDICLLIDKEIECISKRGKVDHSPVWLGNSRLAYISSDDSGRMSELLVYDIGKKSTEEIYKGELYAPDLAPNGNTLVFKGKKNELVLYDIPSRAVVNSILVDLPGLTGPSRFSADGKYLYFAQYMLDSNRDLSIDGRDAAAIYRYDISNPKIAAPIQITSLSQNCSFPYPSKNFLYMTCAFEGALDIYRGPLSGTVPQDWAMADLEEAHMVARSYFDRILFLNHMHNRVFRLSDVEYSERVLQNFVFAGEFTPALFQMNALLAKSPERQDLKAWQILFESYARWEVLPQKRNLGAFAEFIRSQRTALAKIPKSPEASLVDAYLDHFSNNFAAAEQKLQKLQFKDELSLYLSVKLARMTLKDRFQKYLVDRAVKVEASDENRMYFLSLWLSELTPGKDPSAQINALKAQLKEPMTDLLDNEITLYKITQASDDKTNIELKRMVTALVEKHRKNYFVLRLLINRAIVVLYNGKKSRDMGDIVSLWISYLDRKSKEFPYAIEAMRQNFVDLAYLFMNGKAEEQRFAIGAFNDSIRTSDDLESHYQYVTLNYAAWTQFIAVYRTLISQGTISQESWKFIHVIRDIIKAKEPLKAEDYEEAAKKIDAISDSHVGVGMKYLLLGYIYHKQLQFTYDGFMYDKDLAERAHKAYLFAIDGALNNDRIQAAALQNLAVLHLEARNFTLAAEFLQQRSTIAYSSSEEELALTWLKAKTMYLSNRSLDAYAAISSMLGKKPQPQDAWNEKAAFYAWNAAQYETAEKHYKTLSPKALNPSIRLGYAYTLFMQNKGADLSVMLDPLLQSIGSKQGVESVKGAGLKVQPLKQKFLALGLLAQASSVPLDKRVSSLEERLKLYETIKDNAKALHFQLEKLSDQKIKEMQDLSQLKLRQGKKEEAQKMLAASLDEAKNHGEEFGYLGSTLISSLKNAWLMGSNLALDKEQSRRLVNQLDGEFLTQKAFTPLVTQKWAELKLVQGAFLDKNFEKQREDLFKTAAMESLKLDNPGIYDFVRKYADEVAKDVR